MTMNRVRSRECMEVLLRYWTPDGGDAEFLNQYNIFHV